MQWHVPHIFNSHVKPPTQLVMCFTQNSILEGRGRKSYNTRTFERVSSFLSRCIGQEWLKNTVKQQFFEARWGRFHWSCLVRSSHPTLKLISLLRYLSKNSLESLSSRSTSLVFQTFRPHLWSHPERTEFAQLSNVTGAITSNHFHYRLICWFTVLSIKYQKIMKNAKSEVSDKLKSNISSLLSKKTEGTRKRSHLRCWSQFVWHFFFQKITQNISWPSK